MMDLQLYLKLSWTIQRYKGRGKVMTTLDLYQNDYVIVLLKKSELFKAFQSMENYNRLLAELEDIIRVHRKKLRLRLEED